jgi:hypothetical protein
MALGEELQILYVYKQSQYYTYYVCILIMYNNG